VWIGVTLAFGIQCLVAVAAGRLVSLLPQRPVQLVAAGLFALGAILLISSARRGADGGRGRERGYESEGTRAARAAESGTSGACGVRAVFASFGVLFVAEWGDLSQLLTAGLVAQGGHPVAVFAGSWAALAVISAAAVLLGRVVMRYVSLTMVQLVGAGICALL